jgi:hypothetical protein
MNPTAKNPKIEPTTPFTVSVIDAEFDGQTPEEIEAAANDMLRKAKEAKAKAALEASAKLEREKRLDLETLANLKKEVSKLKFVEAGTHDPEKREVLFEKIGKYQSDIQDIETKYGLNVQPTVDPEPVPMANSSAVLVTALKIASLIIACWAIVLYSGDWIVAKYPNAAIYNEVSFQKVLFGFSVFIGGFVSVIIALNVFFPGFGRYFNPFNHSALDFFDDFKTLTPWQRNAISLGLFFCLLFAFVLIAGGKLD